MEVSGNLAYVASSTDGLRVIDVQFHTTAAQLGSTPTAHWAWDVSVHGDVAYVADADSGLTVVDVTVPTAPSVVGRASLGDRCRAVAVEGDRAYATFEDSGLVVFDVGDPASPTVIATLPLSSNLPRDVAVLGNRAYVADLVDGLVIVDVTDPASPVQLGSVRPGGNPKCLEVNGHLVYLGDGASRLDVIDVTDGSSPAVVLSVTDPAMRVWDVDVSGDLAYVADADGGFRIVDVAAPVMLQRGGVTLASDPVDIDVVGDHAFIAAYDLDVVDVSDPDMPVRHAATAVERGISARAVRVYGDYAYVGLAGVGLAVYDISDPMSASMITFRPFAQDIEAMVIDGDHLFAADTFDGLVIVDLANAPSPSVEGTIWTGANPLGVAVAGNRAYVVDDVGSLTVVDVTDPAAPVILDGFSWLGQVFVNLDVHGNRAHVCVHNPVSTYGRVATFGITAESPTLLETYGGSQEFAEQVANAVTLAGQHSYVAAHNDLNDEGGLEIYDLTVAPAVNVDRAILGYSTDVAIQGDHAYVTRWNVAPGVAGLDVVQVYQRSFESDSSRTQSLTVAAPPEGDIVRVRLEATETGSLDWYVTASGSSWTAIEPGEGWHGLSPGIGRDLRWRSEHVLTDLTVSPSCQQLTLDWLLDAAPLNAVDDVPDDQGGWVRLNISRSGYDFADETLFPVTGYQVYRRVDDVSRQAVLANAPSATASTLMGTPVLASLGQASIRRYDGRDHVVGELVQSGEFPPGAWELLEFHAATQQPDYTILAPTVGDSTATGGIDWSVYLVTTHTTTPSVWFASQPDSGYSVDDVAPGVPSGLALAGMELSWDAAPEDDFQYHTVYGSESPTFEETATLIDHTVDPMYDVSGSLFGYYHVTTTDHAGNEGEAASVEGMLLSSPVVPIPTSFAVSTAGANPFGSRASLSMALPEPSSVRVVVHDVGGRVVRTLAEGAYAAGYHSIVWDARDDDGRPVGPGVYFARIKAGEHQAVQRLTMIR